MSTDAYPVTRIENGNLIDTSTGLIRRQRTLHINGSRIAHTSVPIHGVALDATDLWVMPGLIDMHVHLVGHRRPLHAADSVKSASAALTEALAAGVTTVRDLGGPLAELQEVRRAWTCQELLGARPLIGGEMLASAPDGHGIAAGLGKALGSTADAQAAIDRLARAGADHVKIALASAHGRNALPAEIASEAVRAAAAAHLPVAMHVHLQTELLQLATQLPITSIEHGFLLHKAPENLARMRKAGITLTPTLTVVNRLHESQDQYRQRRLAAAHGDATKTVAMAHAAGVNLAAGTDANVFGVGYGDVWQEQELIGQACGSRLAGLQAATCNAGRALRLPIGMLRPDYVADLLLIDVDPINEQVSPNNIVHVVQHGRLVNIPHRRETHDTTRSPVRPSRDPQLRDS